MEMPTLHLMMIYVCNVQYNTVHVDNHATYTVYYIYSSRYSEGLYFSVFHYYQRFVFLPSSSFSPVFDPIPAMEINVCLGNDDDGGTDLLIDISVCE